LLSDAATLSVAGGSTLPCSSGSGDCTATMSFPLYTTVNPTDPGVQCFKVEDGSLLQPAAADGWQLGSIAAAQDDPATQVAQCVVGAGGTYTIGRLRSVPAPAATLAPGPAPTTNPAPVPQQGVSEATPAAATIRASVFSIEEHGSGQGAPDTVGIAVGVTVAGLAVVVAGAALWCIIHRRRAQRVFPGGSQGAEVGHA
jgi:hypothetical protein